LFVCSLQFVCLLLLISFDDGDFDDVEDEEPLDDLENVEDVRKYLRASG